MKLTRFWLLVCAASVLWLLTACGGNEEPAATATPEPAEEAAPTEVATVTGLAIVDSLAVEPFAAGNPGTIMVTASGNLPDGCTTIGDAAIQQSSNIFLVNLRTERPADAACTTALVPYSETISLDVSGLDDGNYSVDINGVSAAFTLGVVAEPTAVPEPTSEPEPTAEAEEEATTGTSVIAGRVIHDLCAPPLESGAPVPEGCVQAEDGSIGADGQLDAAEPGLAAITVELGQGACPSFGLTTTTTDETGAFSFEALPAGAYCVTIDPIQAANADILIPGGFTSPSPDDSGIAQQTITLFEDQTIADVDFGWDYQFLPEPEPVVDLGPCTNSILFIADVTIPDDTALAPGEAFVKTWNLFNNGSCDWTTEYSLVFVDGELMTNDTAFPLPLAVPAGEFIEISVTMIAPLVEGTYRADFRLTDADGVEFGVETDEDDDTFWAQIVVEEGASQPEPNTAVISGTIWADDNGNGTFNVFEVAIEGVEVQLSDGACPGTGLVDPVAIVTTAVTDIDGNYRFESLPGGTYCVSVAAFSSANVELLIPGDWTYPAQGVGLTTVIVAEGEERPFIDFGWLYQ